MIRHQSKPEIYFHAGMPKTASTFLQRQVFPNLTGIHFIKKHDFPVWKDIMGSVPSKKFLLSNEWDIGIERTDKKLRAFAKECPDARVILFFRRHDNWILSKYKYDIRKHGSLLFEDYFNLDDDHGKIKKKHLRYFDKITLVEQLFKHPPAIFFQEELVNDFTATITSLAATMNALIDVNEIPRKTVKKAYNQKQLLKVRAFNKRYPFDPPKAKNPVHKFFSRKPREFVLHSVACLAQLTPEKSVEGIELVPKQELQRIREQYQDDWKACVEYASKQREIHLP